MMKLLFCFPVRDEVEAIKVEVEIGDKKRPFNSLSTQKKGEIEREGFLQACFVCVPLLLFHFYLEAITEHQKM